MKNKISSFLSNSFLHIFGIFFILGIFQTEVRGQIANAPCNVKSPWINGTYTNLAVTGTSSGLGCLGSATNEANLVDSNLSNFASLSLTGLTCTGTFTVKDNDVADTYPVGTFAGFEVSATGLLSASITSKVTIFTYNNGSLVETYNAITSLVGVNSSLLNASGNAVLGFITTQPFDEIRIAYQPLVSVLFTAQIYGAVIEKYCAGPALACNVQTQMNNPTFPTSIDGNNTGITGIVCAGCSVTNSENVISSSTTDFATITLAVAVGSTGSVAVKDNLTSYAAGTFAGFNIANPNLVNLNLLSGITVRTYFAGVLKESSTASTLVSLNSTLLNGSGKQLVGFVTTQAFDEVKIEITNLIGVLNTTQVYNAVFQKFCAGPPLACSTNTYLVTPAYPAVIDGTLTGITGAACVGCSVSNTNNVVDVSTSNFADIVLTLGVLNSGSIAVKDILTTYPIGTFAGFDIENSALIGLGLLNGANVSTYLNGVLQESSAGNLISLTLLSASRQIIGFTTTKTFNEVRFTASNLVGVSLGTTSVYGAVLRGSSAAGVVAPVIPALSTAVKNSCPSSSVNLNSLVTSTTPVGATLVWFTNNAHTGTAYSTPTAAAAGIYYAFYYDSVKDCYSPASTPVTVTITVCAIPDVATAVAGISSTILILSNDKNADGTAVTNLTKITTPTITTIPTKGTATVNFDGSINYTPNIGTSGTDTFIYSICDKINTTACDTALVSIVISNKVCLSPKAYLQGALLGVSLPNTLMRDDLRVKNLIPIASPYPSGLTTANTTTSTVLSVTGNNAIVDWVFVELRSGSDSTLVVDSRSALIQRDGDIVDVDGTGSVIFSLANMGQYYLVVKHRNHLGVMSVKNTMSNACKVIDFQLITTPNFNKDSLNISNQPQVTVQQGRALWAGNALNDTEIVYQGSLNDVNIIYTSIISAGGNFLTSSSYKLKGYYAGDIDMNGETIFQGTDNDVEFIYQNIFENHPGNTLKLNYFKIKQQLP
jgi:hypothetical protein